MQSLSRVIIFKYKSKLTTIFTSEIIGYISHINFKWAKFIINKENVISWDIPSSSLHENLTTLRINAREIETSDYLTKPYTKMNSMNISEIFIPLRRDMNKWINLM